jgi:predicted short-subunit dehydrogenase-like oxidoreductase (DUF2520 family)
VGDGKVARHFAHYFKLLGIEYNCWNRKSTKLKESIGDSDIILLLITDDAIHEFIKKHRCLSKKKLIHFSGTLSLNNAYACHPLMTFAQDLYDLATYANIPFVCDEGVDFKLLFPQLDNPSFHINKESRAYYHALCVMAGNFTQTLMRETANQLNQKLNLPKDILFPYLLQNTKNFIKNPQQSVTGPIQRGDFTTVQKHLQALEGNHLENIYQSFIELNSTRVVDFSQPKHGLKSMPQLLRKAQ